jgi:ectoine hydroxylase-related dioxygenase (phytanoyl-CoA dioxygenase family)
LMEVVDAFFNFFGQQTTLCHHNGARDAGVRENYSAEDEAKMQGFSDLRNRGGWHTDGTCLKDAPDTFAAITVTGLLYLDPTFAHNGAFIAAQGSHHLHFGFGTTDGKSKYPDPEFILDNCELRPLPVEPGGVLLFRGHTWHGVLPTHLKHRRLVLQCFCAKEFYDMMPGHNFNESQADFLPSEKHRYLCSYRDSS